MRTCAFIDGLNLYHGIRERDDLKWCNLPDLIDLYLRSDDELAQINFYTADPKHRPESSKRNLNYCSALKAIGVNVVMGRFDRTTVAAHDRQVTEKETDVNIAIDMVDFAHRGLYEKCVLISADSDLHPAVRRVCQLNADFRVVLLAPPNHHIARNTTALQSACRGQIAVRRMKVDDLAKCPLPETIKCPEGNHIRKPAVYKARKA